MDCYFTIFFGKFHGNKGIQRAIPLNHPIEMNRKLKKFIIASLFYNVVLHWLSTGVCSYEADFLHDKKLVYLLRGAIF
jgi:hypothetical protein